MKIICALQKKLFQSCPYFDNLFVQYLLTEHSSAAVGDNLEMLLRRSLLNASGFFILVICPTCIKMLLNYWNKNKIINETKIHFISFVNKFSNYKILFQKIRKGIVCWTKCSVYLLFWLNAIKIQSWSPNTYWMLFAVFKARLHTPFHLFDACVFVFENS